MPANNTANNTALQSALRELDLVDAHPSRLVLSSPWGAVLPATGEPGLYLVTRGTAWIRANGEERLRELHEGDVALLPRGSTHALTSDPASRTAPCTEFFAEHGGARGVNLRAGGGGPETHVDTLCFRAGSANTRRLMSVVPDLFVLPARPGAAWTAHLARALAELTVSVDADAGHAQAKLSELLFGVALSELISPPGAGDGTGDAKITLALVLIHAALRERWTVGRLAVQVGASRSSFHDRFVRATGQSPMDYVTTARMQRACELLQGHELSVEEVAQAVGYRSAPSFAVAFRRWGGRTPSDARRESRPANGRGAG